MSAAPASAWQLDRTTLDGLTQLVFTSGFSPAGESLTVQLVENPGTDELRFTNFNNPFAGVLPSNCEMLSVNSVECLVTGVQRMTVFFGPKDDAWSSFGTTIKTTVHGNLGDDTFTSRDAGDTLLGEGGNDTIRDNSSTTGTDIIDGGTGDDAIFNGPGPDDIHGGIGVDTVTLQGTNDIVTLDDVADDGGASGEGDNIHSDVENLVGGLGDDSLTGSAAANLLDGGGGQDQLFGGAGADNLIGGAGPDTMFGGPDFDRVTYPEVPSQPSPLAGDQTITLDDVANDGIPLEGDNVRTDIEDVYAGAGADVVVGNDYSNVLDGGPGGDDLTGGGGADVILGGDGIDLLRSRDGVSDRVECNADGGSAIADTTDTVLGCAPIDASDELIPDVDGDGSSKPADCDDHNATIKPGAVDIFENGIDENCDGADAINLDKDADGYTRPGDCDDANAAVHPGAKDVVGNKLDEDCTGKDAQYPELVATTIFGFDNERRARFRALTIVRRIEISRLTGGEKATLRCTGRRCPFKLKVYKNLKRGKRVFGRSLLRGRNLSVGTTLSVRVTAPAKIGTSTVLRVRDHKRPTITRACLQPGSTKPSKCP